MIDLLKNDFQLLISNTGTAKMNKSYKSYQYNIIPEQYSILF